MPDRQYIAILFICLAMFFVSGIQKALNFNNTVLNVESQIQKTLKVHINGSLIALVVLIVILIEILAPVSIVVGHVYKKRKYGTYGSLALIAFTIAATLLYHFPPKGRNYYPFISNVTTVGGLLLILYVTELHAGALNRTIPDLGYPTF